MPTTLTSDNDSGHAANNSDKSHGYLHVALASPLRQYFDYLPEQGQTANNYPLGSRVVVPFGRRKLVGIVIGSASSSNIKPTALKLVEQLLDSGQTLHPAQLKLAQWVSNYYHHPIGDTLFSLLPNQLKQAKAATAYTQRCWRITTHGHGLNDNALARAPKQQALLNYLRQQSEWQSDDSLSQLHYKATTAIELEKKSLLERGAQAYIPANCQSLLQGKITNQPATLNYEQQDALNAINKINSFATVLLEGITGSGKTEVYLQAIERTLEQQKQAIVLVPEIGLTPQTIQRFTSRFNVPIAIFHSSLTDRERLAAWQAAKSGEARIVIGTRSAIFTPLQQPGLIIVDEEHDASYKQQDGLRYSARDVAVMRGRFEKTPVILGSATPSLETLHNAISQKYLHCTLTQRAGEATPPAIELVDIRRSPLHEGYSEQAIQAISQALDKQRQAMVFINRRGFSPLLLCQDCGWYAQCQHCDAKLTLHNRAGHLRCHHCDFQTSVPRQCQRCQSTNLINKGQGTERSAEALQRLFPEQQVIRIDRDTTANKNAMNAHIDTINREQPLILVGTQMLAKGHHFAALDTIVMLDIDQGLYHPDFRAAEKTLQLLTQVAGRAGRSKQQGRVLIQTHLPDHPLLNSWIQSGYQGITPSLLTERQTQGLPPHGFLALIRADSPNSGQALHFLQQLRQSIHSSATTATQLIGPMPALMERRAGRHRAQLLFKSLHRQPLHQSVREAITLIEANKTPYNLRWSVDIDPQESI